MLDAAEAGGDDNENGQVELTKPRKKIPLTPKELIGQVMSAVLDCRKEFQEMSIQIHQK